MMQQWAGAFTAFCGRFAARFPRVESRRRMAGYVRGLLGELERKNGWSLAEAAGDTGPEGMQRLLNSYSWDTDGLRDDVRAVVVEATPVRVRYRVGVARPGYAGGMPHR